MVSLPNRGTAIKTDNRSYSSLLYPKQKEKSFAFLVILYKMYTLKVCGVGMADMML